MVELGSKYRRLKRQ
jgi:hypothetical protein